MVVIGKRSGLRSNKRRKTKATLLAMMKDRMAHWQKRLSLRHWVLTLKVMRELTTDDGRDAYGFIRWREHTRGADIDLMVKDRTTAAIEDTVVHELLHIVRLPVDQVAMRMMEYLSPAAKAELGRDYDDAVECMIYVLVEALRPGAQLRAQDIGDKNG